MINRERKHVGGFLPEACYLRWNAPKAWETAANTQARNVGVCFGYKMTPRSRAGVWALDPLEVLAPAGPPTCLHSATWELIWRGLTGRLMRYCLLHSNGINTACAWECVSSCVPASKVAGRVGIGVAAETRRPVVLASDWYWVSNARRHMRWKLNATPSRYLAPVLVNSRRPRVLAPHNSLRVNGRTQIQILGSWV